MRPPRLVRTRHRGHRLDRGDVEFEGLGKLLHLLRIRFCPEPGTQRLPPQRAAAGRAGLRQLDGHHAALRAAATLAPHRSTGVSDASAKRHAASAASLLVSSADRNDRDGVEQPRQPPPVPHQLAQPVRPLRGGG